MNFSHTVPPLSTFTTSAAPVTASPIRRMNLAIERREISILHLNLSRRSLPQSRLHAGHKNFRTASGSDQIIFHSSFDIFHLASVEGVMRSQDSRVNNAKWKMTRGK